MAKPGYLRLTLVKGTDETYALSLDSPEGTDLNMTGYTNGLFTVYDVWSGTQLFEKSGANVAVTTPASGLVTVTVAAADSSALVVPAGRRFRTLRYRLRFDDASAKTVTLLYGPLYLHAS